VFVDGRKRETRTDASILYINRVVKIVDPTGISILTESVHLLDIFFVFDSNLSQKLFDSCPEHPYTKKYQGKNP